MTSSHNNLLQNFQEYLSVEKGLSDNSIYSYGYDLN
ncbi:MULTISPECIES: site-specific integrase, partial [Leptospira]